MSIATGYRYLHEAIDVIAAHCPELDEVLRHADTARGGGSCAWTAP